jgi:hypothetical protein
MSQDGKRGRHPGAPLTLETSADLAGVDGLTI